MYVYRKKIYVLLFALLDVIGNVFFAPVRLFRRKKQVSFRRILLIRADHIGDVINATVALSPLRRSFPGASIDFLAASWARDVLENNPDIDNIVQFDPPWFDRNRSGFMAQLKGLFTMRDIIKKAGCDIAIELRGDFRHILAMFLSGISFRLGYGITGGGFLLTHKVPYRGRMRETDRNMELLKAIGVENEIPEISLYFTEEDKNAAETLIEKCGFEDKYAVLHAVPGHETKSWNSEKFAAIIRYLFNEKRFIPVVVGTAGDTEKLKEIKDLAGARLIDIAGKTRLGVLYYVLRNASLFVGVDSAPAHMAAVAGIPAVILFSGVNDPVQWAPRGNNVKLVYPGKGKNLSKVQPEEVFRAIDEMLGT